MTDLADWISQHATLLAPLLLGAVALWLLMPREPARPALRLVGSVFGLTSLATGGLWLFRPTGRTVDDAMFAILAVLAIVSAVLMITNRHPVYAALWFAIATLAVCGLFLLRSAPFLAAATMIVYAGAIIVIFLFVIMLAQQEGLATYDRRATQTLPAIVATFVLLGGVLLASPRFAADGNEPVTAVTVPGDAVDAKFPIANSLSRPVDGDLTSMRGLGRSLFGDYLFAVEVAGTLLLVACIGAIAISPRRSRGGL